MTQKFYTVALLLSLLGFIAPTQQADAQCGGAMICAQVSIGSPFRRHRARARVRRQPTVVVVQAQPAPPPRRVVIVRQPVAPPPTTIVTVQAAPVQPQPTYVAHQVTTVRTNGTVALHAETGGLFGADAQMGGVGGSIRFRPQPRFAAEIGLGVYAGTDANGQDRVETPLTLNGMVFFNETGRVQPYLMAGVGVSRAHTQGLNTNTGSSAERELFHIGGQVGAGLELRLSDNIAINGDVRGFIRQNIGETAAQPEFTNPDNGETTNTSAGALATVGATFYFN
jgi:opacity protein-like surface antigen